MTDQYKALKARYLDKNAPSIESEYMIVTASKFTGKTWVYEVVAKKGLSVLGKISWWAPWRQYTFLPESNTIFSPGCLNDISTFIKTLMDERKSIKSDRLRTDSK